ncbi:hypothetical protein YC2023_105819 [Brassica napus]
MPPLLLIHLFQSSQSSTIFCHSNPEGLKRNGENSQEATRNQVDPRTSMYATESSVALPYSL